MTTTRIGDLDGMPGLYVLRSEINDRMDGEIELLHVISTHARGEVRGYKRPRDSAGAWKLRLPAYPVEWPEMDAEVAALIGVEVNGARAKPRQLELAAPPPGGQDTGGVR